jgi:hypothetical protein
MAIRYVLVLEMVRMTKAGRLSQYVEHLSEPWQRLVAEGRKTNHIRTFVEASDDTPGAVYHYSLELTQSVMDGTVSLNEAFATVKEKQKRRVRVAAPLE